MEGIKNFFPKLKLILYIVLIITYKYKILDNKLLKRNVLKKNNIRSFQESLDNNNVNANSNLNHSKNNIKNKTKFKENKNKR